MNNIRWATLAEDAYLTILTRLRDEWNDDVAYNFYETVDRFIDGLKTFKNLCPLSSKHDNLRRCVINKHTSFSYRVSGNDIEIIGFYYNKMNW